jgi:hypothetical protein
LDLEWGYVLAFVFFIVMMFIRPARPAGEALMTARFRTHEPGALPWIAGAALIALPFVYNDPTRCT